MSELCEPAEVRGASATNGGLESPSLFNPAAGDEDRATAYEIKFLVSEAQVAEIAARVRGHLALDAYAEPAMGNAYLTTSVYSDTQAFDVYHRTDGYDRDKLRGRRYGTNGPVFVERKTKRGDKVRKHRAPVHANELAELLAPTTRGEWAGDWFHSELLAKNLRPVCRVTYERVAYLGTVEGGTVRLTFDRNVRGTLCGDWTLTPVPRGAPLLERVIAEFKFRTAMPALFKGIVADLALTPTPVSKYRTFVRGTGLVAERGTEDA